jgi:hypothetical protein
MITKHRHIPFLTIKNKIYSLDKLIINPIFHHQTQDYYENNHAKPSTILISCFMR